jgi:Glycine-rich domain-containing protein-like
LIGSAQRQASFLWQVSGERFMDQDFLEEGVDNYCKFLRLTPVGRQLEIVLVPTYQIDLMWHTHMLFSLDAYNSDCMRIMGSTMSHDDSLTDRSENGLLDTSFKATRGLWIQAYGKDYIVVGGMYRGEPPKEYHSPEWNCETPLPAMTSVILAGASSAPSQHWRKWVPLDGHTRDGKPAFIPISAQTKREVKSAARKDNYILGRYDNMTGYYHIETREAHALMVARMNHRVKHAESDLAMQHGCCGDAEGVEIMEIKLAKVQRTREVWRERLAASKPMGSTRNQDINSERLYRDDGAWLYPTILYTDAGGACGGAAATTGKCQ